MRLGREYWAGIGKAISEMTEDEKIGYSDYRMRHNIQRIADSLERIEALLSREK